MDRNQSQMLLMTSERFGILLAESLDVGSPPLIVPSENIGMHLTPSNIIQIVFFKVFSAERLNGSTAMNVTFNATQFDVPNSIVIPASFIQQRSNTKGVMQL